MTTRTRFDGPRTGCRVLLWLSIGLSLPACDDSLLGDRDGGPFAGPGDGDDAGDGDHADPVGAHDGGDDGDGDGDSDGDGDLDGGDAGARDGGDILDCQPPIESVRLLVVIGQGESMREEHVALRLYLPALMQRLTLGAKALGLSPIERWQVGVVSTDLGVGSAPGLPNCTELGDDGLLLSHCSSADGVVDDRCFPAIRDAACGFEQPLDAMLKAIWPAMDVDPDTGIEHVPNRVTFLGDALGEHRLGHGGMGDNAELLGSAGARERSLLGILIVTDSDDCSSLSSSHWTPPRWLPDGDPLLYQPLPLRCYFNTGQLHTIDRYADALSELQKGWPGPVAVGVIAGMPTDTVSAARAVTDFSDDAARNGFYDRLLDDAAMQERITSDGMALEPACSGSNGDAMPARRLVEFARLHGPHAMVGSVCDGDWTATLDAYFQTLVGAITAATSPGPVCQP